MTFSLLCKLIHKKTNNERDKTKDRFMFQHGGPYTQFHYESMSQSWKPRKKKNNTIAGRAKKKSGAKTVLRQSCHLINIRMNLEVI